MEYGREGNQIIIKLDPNEDILESIMRVCEEEKLKNGIITSGLGAAADLEVGYLKGKEHVKMLYEKRAEIVSIAGSISQEEPRLHVHIAFADEEHRVHGGHLFSGKVNPMMEIFITELSDLKLGRKLSEKSGFKELAIL